MSNCTSESPRAASRSGCTVQEFCPCVCSSVKPGWRGPREHGAPRQLLPPNLTPQPGTSLRGVLGDTEYTRQEPCPQRLGYILETKRQQGGRWNTILGELSPFQSFCRTGDHSEVAKQLQNSQRLAGPSAIYSGPSGCQILSILSRHRGTLHLHYLLLFSEQP